MANLRKNIEKKRLIQKRENSLSRKVNTPTESALKNVTVTSGTGLKQAIENVKALRTSAGTPSSQPTSVYHKYGKNSVKRIKVS